MSQFGCYQLGYPSRMFLTKAIGTGPMVAHFTVDEKKTHRGNNHNKFLRGPLWQEKRLSTLFLDEHEALKVATENSPRKTR